MRARFIRTYAYYYCIQAFKARGIVTEGAGFLSAACSIVLRIEIEDYLLSSIR